mgnify:CR=1 FL=1
MRLNFKHSAGDVEVLFFLAINLNANLTGFQSRKKRSVTRRNTDSTPLGGCKYHRCRTRKDLGFGADDIDVQGHCHISFPELECFCLLGGFIDAANHVEGLFREAVVVSVRDTLEPGDGVFE